MNSIIKMKAETCRRGEEQVDIFYSSSQKTNLFQYDYRTREGKLFSCVGTSLTDCRQQRDKWERALKEVKE